MVVGRLPAPRSGRERQGAQSSQGAAELVFPGPTLGKMPGEAPRRACDASGGCSPRPALNWPCSPPTAITPASLIGMATPWNWKPTIAATPRSRTPSATSSTAWGSTISPQGASPPTPPGWRYRRWRITWPVGQRASVWTSNWQPPRPSGGGSSPSPDGSPARRAAHPAPSPALALGSPVQLRLGPIASHSPTSLTARRRRPTLPPDNPWAVPHTRASPAR